MVVTPSITLAGTIIYYIYNLLYIFLYIYIFSLYITGIPFQPKGYEGGSDEDYVWDENSRKIKGSVPVER
jgi:hypothetical protein